MTAGEPPSTNLYCKRSIFRTKSLRAPAATESRTALVPGLQDNTNKCNRGVLNRCIAGCAAGPTPPLAPLSPCPTCRLGKVEHTQGRQQGPPCLDAGLSHGAQAMVGEQGAPLHFKLLPQGDKGWTTPLTWPPATICTHVIRTAAPQFPRCQRPWPPVKRMAHCVLSEGGKCTPQHGIAACHGVPAGCPCVHPPSLEPPAFHTSGHRPRHAPGHPARRPPPRGPARQGCVPAPPAPLARPGRGQTPLERSAGKGGGGGWVLFCVWVWAWVGSSGCGSAFVGSLVWVSSGVGWGGRQGVNA